MTTEEATMARPKKDAKKVQRPADERIAIIHLKGTAGYAAWLDELHEKTHIAKASLVRLGLERIAKEYGHRKPPKV